MPKAIGVWRETFHTRFPTHDAAPIGTSGHFDRLAALHLASFGIPLGGRVFGIEADRLISSHYSLLRNRVLEAGECIRLNMPEGGYPTFRKDRSASTSTRCPFGRP